MGEIIKFVCKCGYNTNLLSVGCGMCGPDYVYVLCHCKKCKDIRTINSEKSYPHICNKCKEHLSIIDLPDDVGYEVLSIPCPKCEENNLEFIDIGNWD